MSGSKRGLQGRPTKPSAGSSHALADVEGQDRSAWVVPTVRVTPDPDQPRRHFDEEALDALAQDIAKRGVRQALSVYKHEDGFRIIAGERRYRAALKAGLQSIPVRLVEAENVLEEQLIENLQREDLNPVDEADAIHAFKTTNNLTVREVGERLSLSKSAVDRKLKIVAMPTPVRERLQLGEISFQEAERLTTQTPQKESAKRGRPASVFTLKEKAGGAFDATIRFRPGKMDRTELIEKLQNLIKILNEMPENP